MPRRGGASGRILRDPDGRSSARRSVSTISFINFAQSLRLSGISIRSKEEDSRNETAGAAPPCAHPSSEKARGVA
ncbi:hypothetical protein ALC62_03915 [Cyphomyrmex costatus]|uniref:Uncharacterized protein n=1 Tax=Cyphomyrmex costatus TaxID=456900 RepID=A0A195CWT9_9HYME|nr:hypothetical protein ALC62_03915 [Cyphomyrmex costatus]